MSKPNMTELIIYFSKKWELSNLRSLDLPFNNYIAIAFSANYNIDVVLKILLVDTHEIEALRLFNGHSCVKLLEYDLDKKGMLLEYIQPGITLKTLFPVNDSEAAKITAEIIKNLVVQNYSQESVFKTVNQWLEVLHNLKSKRISEHLLKKAKRLAEQLLSAKQELYLLHGDLHHDNILQFSVGSDDWIAIDPKGVIGPLEYEVGRFIMNPFPDLLQHADAKEIIKTRIDIFSEIFGFEKQRLLDWVFVQAVLSACWTEQNKNEMFFNYFIKFAQTIESLHLDSNS